MTMCRYNNTQKRIVREVKCDWVCNCFIALRRKEKSVVMGLGMVAVL